MKNRWQFLLILFLFAALAACGPAGNDGPTPMPPTLVPLVLTDDLGRAVTLPAIPQRIISLSPTATEILFAIGAGGSVVGVTTYCDYPAEAQSLPKVGGYSANTISVETILSLQPDLIVAAAEEQQALIADLEKAGLVVISLAPLTFDQVYADIELIGRATGHLNEATEVVQQMQARLAAVRQVVSAVPPEKRPTVFWEVFDEPLMTAGPSSFIGQMIELAGGANTFADLAEEYPQVSVEQVITRDPGVIMGPNSHGTGMTPEQLAARPGWDHVDAVKNRRVYWIDANIVSRPGPRLVDAVEAIAGALYPDLFP